MGERWTAALLLATGLVAAASSPLAAPAYAGTSTALSPTAPLRTVASATAGTPGTGATSAAGQQSGAPVAACATPKECLARLSALQRETRTLRAAFRQTKRVALLREPLVSQGLLLYRAPDRVRWQVTDPEPLVVDIAGDSLRAGTPGRLEAVDAGGAAASLRDLAAIFTAAGELAGPRFEVAAGSEGPSSFSLTPLDPSLARVVAGIEVELDPAAGVPRRAVLRETNGDRTEIDLVDVERNVPLGPELLP